MSPMTEQRQPGQCSWREEKAGMGGIIGCSIVKDHTGDKGPFDIHFYMSHPLPTLQLLLPWFQNEFGARIHFLSQKPKEGTVELWPKWKGLMKAWLQMGDSFTIQAQMKTQRYLRLLDTLIGCLFVLTRVSFQNQCLLFILVGICLRQASCYYFPPKMAASYQVPGICQAVC